MICPLVQINLIYNVKVALFEICILSNLNGYYNLICFNNIRATMQTEDHGNRKYTKIKNSNIKSIIFVVICPLKVKYESSP